MSQQMLDALTKGAVKDGHAVNTQDVLRIAVEVLNRLDHRALARELEDIRKIQQLAIESCGCSCMCHEGACSSAPPYCGHNLCIDPEVAPTNPKGEK